MKRLFEVLNLFIFKKQWKKINSHNYTYAINKFNLETVEIGNKTYGPIELYNDVPNIKLKVGSYCSIGKDTIFLLGNEHNYRKISTYPFKYKILKKTKYESYSKGDIIVDDDVWFGQKTTILSGVHIGQGAIIATGSVVTKSVPPYAIVAGVPAKIIKYRFNETIVKELVKIKYENLSESKIQLLEKILYEEINENNVKEIVDKINDMNFNS